MCTHIRSVFSSRFLRSDNCLDYTRLQRGQMSDQYITSDYAPLTNCHRISNEYAHKRTHAHIHAHTHVHAHRHEHTHTVTTEQASCFILCTCIVLYRHLADTLIPLFVCQFVCKPVMAGQLGHMRLGFCFLVFFKCCKIKVASGMKVCCILNVNMVFAKV